jgi:hypothetical protein
MAYCLYDDSEQRCCADECKLIATKCHSEKTIEISVSDAFAAPGFHPALVDSSV